MSNKSLLIINSLISKFDLLLDKLPKWVSGCYSDYPLQSIINIRKLLSNYVSIKDQYKIIKQVIDSGVVPQIIKLLNKNQYQFEMLCSGYIRDLNIQYVVPQEIINCIDKICIMDKAIDDKLQDEGRWILTNITSGTPEQTKYIVDNGGISILMNGIREKTSISVKRNSIQALGNIAGTNTEYRDLLLSNDILTKVSPIYFVDIVITNSENKQEMDLLRCATWILSNLCAGNNSPEIEYGESMVETLCIMIKMNDADILSETCWSLSYLTNPKSDNISLKFYIQEIIECTSLNRLVELLDHKESTVRHPALRTIGNIIANTDEYTEDMIDLGILDKLYKLMYDKQSIKREALWVVSNIANDSNQIEQVVGANLFHPLINILKTQKYNIAKEALWAVANATEIATDSQIAFLVYKDVSVITALFQFLTNQTDGIQPKIIMVALQGIVNILDAGKRLNKYGPNEFMQCVEENHGVLCLKQIQSNQSFPVYIRNKADGIIKQFF